jgi:hypothetical protein
MGQLFRPAFASNVCMCANCMHVHARLAPPRAACLSHSVNCSDWRLEAVSASMRAFDAHADAGALAHVDALYPNVRWAGPIW